MLQLVLKTHFSLLVALSIMLTSQTKGVNPSDSSATSTTPQQQHNETVSAEYYYVSAPETEKKELLSPEYPSPSTVHTLAPEPAVESQHAMVDDTVAAPVSMPLVLLFSSSENEFNVVLLDGADGVDAPAPPPVELVPGSKALTSNTGVEDEVDEFTKGQEAYSGDQRKVIGIVIGVLVGVLVVGLGGILYNKNRDKIRALYQSLAKRERIS